MFYTEKTSHILIDRTNPPLISEKFFKESYIYNWLYSKEAHTLYWNW